MADYSKHQKKIINNFYEHRDTAALQSLSEIVSDLYLCESEKKSATLWQKAEAALGKLKTNPAQLRTVLDSRDVTKLAQLVQDLQG